LRRKVGRPVASADVDHGHGGVGDLDVVRCLVVSGGNAAETRCAPTLQEKVIDRDIVAFGWCLLRARFAALASLLRAGGRSRRCCGLSVKPEVNPV